MLGVGDPQFREKSKQRILKLVESTATVVLVSHSFGLMKEICDRLVFVDRGEIVAVGEPDQLSTLTIKLLGENMTSKEMDQLLIPPILGLGNDYTFIENIKNQAWADESKVKRELPVSIVIPVYNRKEILAKTLAGIVHQTYPLDLIEVIIADDGSSDCPNELVSEFEKYFDIKYVYQKILVSVPRQ